MKAAAPHRPYAVLQPLPDDAPPMPHWTEPALEDAALPRFLRLIGWTLASAGFASAAVAFGGGLIVAGNLDRLAPDPYLRLGLLAGVCLALPLAVLAAVAGLNLLLLREWARLAALAVLTTGLFLALLAVATAFFGGLVAGFRLAPSWLVLFALAGTLTLVVFFAWAIPNLTHPQTLALFHPRAARPASTGRP